MGGIRKNPGQVGNEGGANISIAISIGNALNQLGGAGGAFAQAGNAVAMAGPNGAFAGAGGPGGLGSLCPCGSNHNPAAMANNFGGPQNPQQAGFAQGFRQGQMAAKMQKLMRQMHRLMASMNGGAPGMGGPGFGGPGFGPGFGNIGGGFPGNGFAFGGMQAFAGSNFGTLV